MNYSVIRSSRKTLGIQVTENGIVVRAPYFATNGQIERFVQDHYAWIQSQLKKQEAKRTAIAGAKVMTQEQFTRLKKLAKQYIPQRIAYYAPLVGVAHKVKQVYIRCQKTKWGSCTSQGRISINCLLMLAPKEVIDAVVVHELCHLKRMDHSKFFYAEVLRVYPQYRKWNKWLKDNGAMLQAMVPGRR